MSVEDCGARCCCDARASWTRFPQSGRSVCCLTHPPSSHGLQTQSNCKTVKNGRSGCRVALRSSQLGASASLIDSPGTRRSSRVGPSHSRHRGLTNRYGNHKYEGSIKTSSNGRSLFSNRAASGTTCHPHFIIANQPFRHPRSGGRSGSFFFIYHKSPTPPCSLLTTIDTLPSIHTKVRRDTPRARPVQAHQQCRERAPGTVRRHQGGGRRRGCGRRSRGREAAR